MMRIIFYRRSLQYIYPIKLNMLSQLLQQYNITFWSTLTDKHINELEKFFWFCIPTEYKEVLKNWMPVGNDFTNWSDQGSVQKSYDILLDWILFDILTNNLWFDRRWESISNSEKIKIITNMYDKSPKLIPIYWHRFILEKWYIENNPVFSIHQSDVIIYWESLEQRVNIEFWNSKLQNININNYSGLWIWSDLLFYNYN